MSRSVDKLNKLAVVYKITYGLIKEEEEDYKDLVTLEFIISRCLFGGTFFVSLLSSPGVSYFALN
jgi:hypothetical protein